MLWLTWFVQVETLINRLSNLRYRQQGNSSQVDSEQHSLFIHFLMILLNILSNNHPFFKMVFSSYSKCSEIFKRSPDANWFNLLWAFCWQVDHFIVELTLNQPKISVMGFFNVGINLYAPVSRQLNTYNRCVAYWFNCLLTADRNNGDVSSHFPSVSIIRDILKGWECQCLVVDSC